MTERAILVITHGEFGIELVKSAEMIMGPLENVNALALRPGNSVDDLREEANTIVEKNKENGLETVVLVDLLGGSPSNVALSLLAKNDLKILTGVNMPMLIEMYSLFNTENDVEKLVNAVKETSVNGINKLDREFVTRR